MSLTAKDDLGKARRALASAQVLLEHGDVEGACNRAYYAMFDAAHAALIASGVGSEQSAPRKHSGLIGAFGLQLVKSGRVSADLGMAINKVERLRRLADYTGDPISESDARWAVEQANIFVAAMDKAFPGPKKP